jgi:hypothetical protein
LDIKAQLREFNYSTHTDLNSIRVQGFVEFAKYLDRKGMTIETDLQEFKKAADHINTMTGRASLGKAETGSGWLNAFFFAPRKVVSELKLFTPYVFVYYGRMPKYVRKKAVGDFLQYITTLFATNAFVWAARSWDDDKDEKAKDEFWNPMSSDFLTHKSGDTRIDVTGGARTSIVFMARTFTQKITNAQGKTEKLGDRYGKRINTWWDLGEEFVANKLSPVISFAKQRADLRKGEEYDLQDEMTNLAIPMFAQDLSDIYKENPDLVATGLTILGMMGASIRVQEDQITKIPNKIKAADKTVELKGKQYEEYEALAKGKIIEYQAALLSTNEYVVASKEEKEKLDEMVRNAGIKWATEQMREKYPDLLPEKTDEEKELEKEKNKELKYLKEELGIDND